MKKFSRAPHKRTGHWRGIKLFLLVGGLILLIANASSLAFKDPGNLSSNSPSAVSGVSETEFHAFSILSQQTNQVSGQSVDGVWREVADDQKIVLENEDQTWVQDWAPKSYRPLRLDAALLKKVLSRAPKERIEAEFKSGVVLTLPMADGGFMRFRIQESPIMEAALAAQFPKIRTYSGQSLDEPTITTRFDWTPQGFHAIILSTRGTILIQPRAPGDVSNYIAYFQREMPAGSFACGIHESDSELALTNNLVTGKTPHPEVVLGTTLRTYRLAVAATGEFTQRYGSGTVSGGLSAVTTTVNLVNAIYEREVAVRLVLIANESEIIFTDPATDGYTSDNVGALIGENQAKLDTVIGSANYDIGHVFDGRSAPGGGFSFRGQASIASVCNSSVKARGVSITRSVQPNSVIAYYSTAHEMGHQFGATHTFNASTGECGSQRTSFTAYEPGTGSTIMGYRFNCGSADLMSSDTYFHVASLEQIFNFTNAGNGNSCATPTGTGNSPPAVNAGPAYTIPRSTPFVLTASANDPDGDGLTYAWEEFDLGPAAPPDTDDGSRPIFRSFAPVSSPGRVFPRLFDILSGLPSFGESLPVTTRTMNFRVTARDNRTGGGGVSSAATQVNVRADAGPFIVTQPMATTGWTTQSIQTVTWDVANTNNAPVSCSTVRISLSTDGGDSFPIVLANNTPNDGSEVVTIPGTPSPSCRVKVESIGNIFFNISQNFSLTGAANTTPAISSFSPAGGSQGAAATIAGTNFISPTAVRFNGVDASFTVSSTTEIVATVPVGATTGPITVVTASGVATSAANFTVFAATVDLTASNYLVSEGAGTAQIIVTRSDTNGAATVDFATTDNAALNECNVVNSVGSSRCDYATSIGTLRFAAGESSKTIFVPVVDDSYAEGNETFTITLSNPIGTTLGSATTANITIQDNETINGPNPIDGVDFFIRQNYIDFLGREPDPPGLAGWRNVLVNCGVTIAPPCDRIEVSAGFFRSEEFQSRGYFIYRFYSAVGRIPLSEEFYPDFAKVSGFLTADQLEANKVAFVNEFMARAEFQTKYSSTFNNPTAYVDALLQTVGLPAHPSRAAWIAGLTNGSLTRAQVLRQLVESSEVYNKYYNEAFVIMQYFGYLRRTADASYLNWIQTMSQTGGDYRTMINGFMNSAEYRRRFGP
ncbi:MAG: reprolysin-like metallopeptidase [Acidobacteriota bacterium]